MSPDPSQRARTVINHLGSPLIAGALRTYPRSLDALRAEAAILPALALSLVAVSTGMSLEWDGMAQAGVAGLLVACLGLAVAARSWLHLHEERLMAAWLISQGLRRGWLAAVDGGTRIRLVERSGDTYATLSADHPCASWVVEGFAAPAEQRAAA